jgi:N6-L-threonylcarbamoyladenine synthase
MIILTIETSCDDTGIALIEEKNKKLKVLSDTVSSQEDVHKKWGGVYPLEAKREHQKNLIPCLKKVLKTTQFIEKGNTPYKKEIEDILQREPYLLEETKKFFKNNKLQKKIDAIAVTVGPGLDPCLWVGVNFAHALSLYLDTPIIPINHIKAHILFFLFEKEKINFPAIALVVSGGHTELILMKSLYAYEIIGKTRDDAAGECFDKTARVLGLLYPGGPEIGKIGSKRRTENRKPKFNIKLPRPMKHSKNHDFSFSGLKTAVLYDFLARSKKTQKDKDYIDEMAKEIEEAITDVLVFKLEKAINEYNAKTVVLGGGVTANKLLQEKTELLKEKFKETEFLLPTSSFSTDNAKMIGAAAVLEKRREKKVKTNPNLKICDKIEEL